MLQKWDIGLHIDRASLKTLLHFGFRFQLNDFLARIKDQLFYVVLGLFLPLREFGFVQWAKNWSLYPYNLTVQNVMAITFPTFARLQHDKVALRKAIETSLFFITVAIFPILIGMCVFIMPFIDIFPVYEKWKPAVPSLIFFTLSIGWSAISSPLTNTLSAVGSINKTLQLMIMWTTLTWILTPILLYFFGFNGVALAAFVISCSSYASVHYVKKVVDFSFLDQIKYQSYASIVMTIVCVLGLPIWGKNIFFFGLGLVVAAISYGVPLYILGKAKLRTEFAKVGIKVPFITV